MAARTPAAALDDLFVELFDTPDELRRFLVRVDPRSLSSLASSGSLAQISFEASQYLMRRALVDADFFVALREVRAGRVAQIDAVAQLFGLAPAKTLAPLVVNPAPYSGPEPAWPSDAARERTSRLRALYAAQSNSKDSRIDAEIGQLEATARDSRSFPMGGSLLARGRYLVLRSTAEDALTTWWTAWDERRVAVVTLRLVHRHLRERAASSALFEAVRQMRTLGHPGVLRVLEDGIDDADITGFCQEYVGETTLADWVPEHPRLVERAGVLAAIGDALEAAHGLGLYHLGFAPELVLMDEAGRPHVCDFGFARAAGLGRTGSASTSVELRFAQTAYAAPELREPDFYPVAADIYSFGKLCQWALRGAEAPSIELPRLEAVLALLALATKVDPASRRVGLRALVVELRGLTVVTPSPNVTPRAAEPSLKISPATDPFFVTERNESWQLARSALVSDTPLNPFRPGTPLHSAELPAGRAEDFARLLARIRVGASAALIGPRRVGKTSLLNYAAGTLKQWRFYSLSLSSVSLANPDELAEELDPSLEGEAKAARKLARKLKDQPSVLLLDELGHLVHADFNAQPSVFGWLRDVGQQGTPVVLAGSSMDYHKVLAHAGKAPGSSFGNDFPMLPLGPLSRSAGLAFLESTAPTDVPIRGELGGWIVDICGPWPFYLQVMGAALVDAARSGQNVAAERDRIRDLYERKLLVEYTAAFRSRWSELPPLARRVLLDATDGLPDHTSLSPAERQNLQQAELISPGRGWLIREDPPFLDWLSRNRADLAAEEAGP